MIEKRTIYKIEFTEEQVKDLYNILNEEYHKGTLEIDYDKLFVIYDELRRLYG